MKGCRLALDLLLVIITEISSCAASSTNMDVKFDAILITRPRSSMVERVTSNDEVAGSIPSEGIHTRLQTLGPYNFFCIFLVVQSFSEARKIFTFFWGQYRQLRSFATIFWRRESVERLLIT